ELEYTHIPALIYEEGDDEAVAFAIADNRTAELAEWDFKNLSEHLAALEGVLDITDLGWSDAERDKLMVFSLDGEVAEQQQTAARESKSTPIDPDSIGSYDEAKDFYLLKIEKVPPAMKD